GRGGRPLVGGGFCSVPPPPSRWASRHSGRAIYSKTINPRLNSSAATRRRDATRCRSRSIVARERDQSSPDEIQAQASRVYSYLSATIGSTRAALRAGRQPAIIAPAVLSNTA